MDYNLLIDRVQEALFSQGVGQKIWMQSATDREAGDAHAEGLAITVGEAWPASFAGADAETEPAGGEGGEAGEVFTVVYFRVFPGLAGADGDAGDGSPTECTVELGYANPHHDLEDAKAEALSLLPSLPRPAFLDRIRDPHLAASSLEELEAPGR